MESSYSSEAHRFSRDWEALGTCCRCRCQGHNRERYSSAPSVLGAYLKALGISKRHPFGRKCCVQIAALKLVFEPWTQSSRKERCPSECSCQYGNTATPTVAQGKRVHRVASPTPTPERFRITLRFQDQKPRLRGFLSPQTFH